MEHIVQFAIGIDDEAIKERIVANAEKAVLADLKKTISDQIFEKSYYGKPTGNPSPFVSKKLDEFIEENADAIIEAAATKLADKLSRTKKVKLMIDSVISEV